MKRIITGILLLAVAALSHGCGGSSARPTTPTSSRQPALQESVQQDDLVVEEGFRALTLADFEPFFAKPPKPDSPATWTVEGSEIVCSGKPKGYLVSKESFGDFTLRLELRFVPSPDESKQKDFNPNTGVLLFIQPPQKQWPKSLEVQGKFAELGTVKENGGAAKVELNDNPAARESARKPVAEWNRLEIESRAGALTVRLNDSIVCSSHAGELTSGKLGLQSEDFAVRFRRLRVRVDSADPAN